MNYIDTKANYTNKRFYEREGKGETFLPACWDFLTFNLVFVLIMFIMLRYVFRLLFNYRISILFRAYSSFIYIIPLLLDSNLQYFFFLMFSQKNLLFSLNFRDKMFNLVGIFSFFFIFFASVVSCFMSYYLCKKLSKYILDNWRTKVHGLLCYSISNFGRMLVFGCLHNLLRS